MKVTKLAFELSTLIVLYVIPISVITMPNQSVQALCIGPGSASECNDTQYTAVCDIGECVVINEAYQSGTKVVFRFSGSNDTNFFNIRYPIKNGEKQVENRSGSFTISNVKPNRVYTIYVQGCVSHTLRRSTCSGWSDSSVTTH